MAIHRFESFGEKSNENEDKEIKEASKNPLHGTVKYCWVETRNFEFQAVFDADTDDEEIKYDFIMMAQAHAKQYKIDFDASYWKDSVLEDMGIIEIPINTWLRDKDEVKY